MGENNFKLEVTKNHFKVAGLITRLTNNNKAYREGVTKNGQKYRSLRFGIQTSPDNTVFVEIFGSVTNEVGVSRMKDGKFEFRRVPWNQRTNLGEGEFISGFNAVRVKADPSADRPKSFTSYDAIDLIRKSFKDGDSVYVSGEIEYSTYNERLQTRFKVNYISKNSDDKKVDFEAEDFKEISHFEMGMIVVDCFEDQVGEGEDEETVTRIIGRTIYYGDKFIDAPYVIRQEADPRLKKLADSARNVLGFGDHVIARGRIVNKVIEKEAAEEEVNIESIFAGGIDEGVFAPRVTTEYINELQILDLVDESYVKEKYTEEDFAAAQVVKEEKKEEKSLFSGGIKEDSGSGEDNEGIDINSLFGD